MASVNKVIVLGNVGKDPEVRSLPNGSAVCQISIATSRKWKDKATGDQQEETEWHRVTFFERQAEIVGEYVKKGSPLYVEGRLRTRKYTDKDGVEKFATEIIATELQLLGSREGGGQGGQTPQQRQAVPQGRAPAPTQQRAPQRQSAAPAGGNGSWDDIDSDIPF
jgi:single-strand DNA-binding protein